MYNDCINQQNNYKIAVVTVELILNLKLGNICTL